MRYAPPPLLGPLLGLLLGLLLGAPAAALAQTSFVGPDGTSRYPGVTILCPAGTRAAACNFGSGGGGGGGNGNVSITLGGAPVGSANRFPTADQALDAIIGGGALNVSGTVGLAGALAGPPGAATAQAVTVQGSAAGLPLPVSGTFWQGVQPVSAAALPLPAGAATAAAQTSVQSAPGAPAATALTVQGNSSGTPLPVSGTFWQSVQPVSAASLPLPAGAATAAAQTSVQSAPGTAAGTALTVQGASGGVPLSVACASGCLGANPAVGATGSAAPASAIAIGLANATGNLTLPVLAADGGIPAHVSNFPATQQVSAASLPLPAGAATAAAQTSVQSAPGTAAGTALTVQGASGGIPLSVACASGCAGANPSVGATGAASPGSATAIGYANAAGNLTTPVLAADGGAPAHVTNFPATQPVSEAVLDPLVTGGALAVSATAWPLPAGAAKAAYQTNGQAPVAPAAATATVSTLIGCIYNASLPSFTSGQQGAVQCDAAGRPIVTTVPSANNVPSYLQAVSSGGAASYRAINAASSAMAASIKAAGGMVYGFDVCNAGAASVYFRLFNLNAAPTVGGSTPAIARLVPAAGCATFSTDVGVAFGTGIALDVTSGSLADADTGTIAAASQVSVQVYYK